MTTFLSKEVRDGLDKARIESLKCASRLRLHAGNDVFPVLRLWKQGFLSKPRLFRCYAVPSISTMARGIFKHVW